MSAMTRRLSAALRYVSVSTQSSSPEVPCSIPRRSWKPLKMWASPRTKKSERTIPCTSEDGGEPPLRTCERLVVRPRHAVQEHLHVLAHTPVVPFPASRVFPAARSSFPAEH